MALTPGGCRIGPIREQRGMKAAKHRPRWLTLVVVLMSMASLGALPRPGIAGEATSRHCPGPVAGIPPVVPAALDRTALIDDEVRLTFVGHATFLIESPHRVRIATDYNDAVETPVLPDIITMNHAHATHYTDHPDPGIKVVLRGWNDDGTPAIHDVAYGDVRVRNVPTNIRNGAGGTERYGNSVFIFELGGLCVAHLGHLHHTLTAQQRDAIGPLDVVMAPVDGTYTLDLAGMIDVLRSLDAALMIPMHFFSGAGLERFLTLARAHWPIERSPTPSVVVSRSSLPTKPTVLVLPGH
jgi:L-ascorbate metabolism protein UlaG (beta-lactamase superfamily)